MNIKKIVYFGMVFILAFSSVAGTSSLALAADTNSSSSSSSIQASTSSSTSSSGQTSSATSSSAKEDSSSTDQATKTTMATPQDTTEPVGTPSNADTPSKDGWSFLLTIFRKGFSVQPPSEQYISVTNIAKAKFSGMQILTTVPYIGWPKISVNRWHWDATTAKWVQDKNQPNASSSGWLGLGGLIGFFNVDDYKISTLTEGSYYYQFSYTNGGHVYASDLAKVVVTPKPIATTGIDTNTDNADGTPKVIFSDVGYAAKAILTPVNSTDSTAWAASGTTDKLSFDPSNLRATKLTAGNGSVSSSGKYTPDSYYTTKVNTDPKTPGILANYKVSAGNITANKKLYVGGLPAYNAAADVGGAWSVGGLSDLQTASQANDKWHYTWKFTDSSGKAIVAPTVADGVTNVEGDVDNISNLNSQSPLTFTRDSSFMTKAAAATANGKSYRAQVTFTTNIVDENGKSQTITVVSNMAELQATAAKGYLSLDEVPSFDFGDINTTDIYNGSSEKLTAKESTFAVTDTTNGHYWNISAQMSRFKDSEGNHLENNVLIHDTNMSGQGGLVIHDNNVPLAFMSYTNGSYSSKVNGIMELPANHKSKLTDGDKYTSTIIWTLAGNTPAAGALK